MNSNLFKICSIKIGPSQAQKFEIKYGLEGFDERNNFLYKNFLRLEMSFEWKFREASQVWIWWNFFLGPQILMNFCKGYLCAPRWPLNTWGGLWDCKLGIPWLGFEDLNWNKFKPPLTWLEFD
jgi:hypothetical protein